jgi:hypothetical protein
MEGGLHRMLKWQCQGRPQPLSIPILAQPMGGGGMQCAACLNGDAKVGFSH